MRLLRRLARVVGALLVVCVVVTIGVVATGWQAFGKSASGARLDRMRSSARYDDGAFTNVDPMYNDMVGAMAAFTKMSPTAEPEIALPVVNVNAELWKTPPASDLRVTWLGHSTVILEIDGVRLLTDPIFGGRASPFTWVGPKVWYEPPLPLEALPPVDAVLISHDHHDHLQHSTMARLVHHDTTFVVPLGVGAHLEYWGAPASRIVELDWGQTHDVNGVTVVSTPSRHASGRHVFDQMATLWTSYAIKGPRHSVFFSGDTGLFAGMKDIGAEHGPFDVVMVEVGAYSQYWPDWHIGPEQALLAHEWLRGTTFMPIHWGLWNLAAHGWTDPVERVVREAERKDIKVIIPRPGESLEPTTLKVQDVLGPKLLTTPWWPPLPFDPTPVVSTRVPGVSPEPDPRVAP